ncbi:hypothetical protein MCOR28_005610 [Pyricularia oryzae]|nr:hypothetical protein MCOR28_005610 [Pyricularia oryzae]
MSAAYTARKFLVIGFGSVKGDYETAVDHVLKFLVEVGEVVLPQYWKTENGPYSSLKNCYGFGGMSPHSNPGNG